MFGRGLSGFAGFGFVSISFMLILFLCFLAFPVFSAYSAYGNFSVQNETVYVNWSSGFVNVTSYTDYINISIINTSTGVFSLYYQNDSSLYWNGSYSNLTETTYSYCFSAVGFPGMKFIVQNGSMAYSNVNFNVSNGTSTNFTITAHMLCPPGRYSGNVTLNNTNHTYANDSVNIMVTFDIPISRHNVLNETTYTGWLKGKIPLYNETGTNETYHKYYMNTSELENVSGFTATMTGYTDDLDLFLFDENGVLINQSINKSSLNEEISFARFPSPNSGVMWEFRVYGNVTSSALQNYNISLYFTTLDALNSSNESQRINSLNFGALISNQSNSSEVFRLANMDDQNLTNVNETKELYHIKIWNNGSTGYNETRNFTDFLVVNFTERIEVSIEWGPESGKNITDWDLYLYDNSGNLINSSTSKYINANITNGTRTEYITYSGPFNSSNDGFWKIYVVNMTSATGAGHSLYKVRAKMWLNASAWINTNFTANTSFAGNATGGNSSYDVNVTITVPSRNIINGSYRGFLIYSNGSGWKFMLPLKFDVYAGMLIMNNSISNATYAFRDNIGFNKTINISIPYENIGGLTIYYNESSSYSLVNTNNASAYINFSVELPGGSDRAINPGENSTINITIYLDVDKTGNQEGVYTGNITFFTNTTNETKSSYPYSVFTQTITLNLSRYLDVSLDSITPTNINGTAQPVTFTLSVRLANGTVISKNNIMNYQNFTSVSVRETNVSSYTQSFSSIESAVGSSACGVSTCSINATSYSGLKGGNFNVTVSVSWNTSMYSDGYGAQELTGRVTNGSLYVQELGLYIIALNSTSIGVINEGSYKYFYVGLINYGNRSAAITADQISFNKGSCQVTLATSSSYSNCSVSAFNTSTYNYTLAGLATQQCYFYWRITGNSVSSDSSCSDASIQVNTDNVYNSMTGISLTVNNTGTGSSSSSSNPSETVNRSLSILAYPSHISIKLNETNTSAITVSNTGNVSITAQLSVIFTELQNASVYITPSNCSLSSTGTSCIFTVKINVSNTTLLGNYSGIFKAVSTTHSSVYSTKDFVLSVLPTPEREEEINYSYTEYFNDFLNLSSVFEGIKASGLVSEDNISKVELLLNQTNETINQMKAYISAGDFVSAEGLLEDLKLKLDRIRTEILLLSEEEQVKMEAAASGIWIWVVIVIVIIGAAGLLIYMFLPPEGYKHGRGFIPKKERDMRSRIKELLKKFISKFRGSGEGIKSVRKAFKRKSGYKFKPHRYSNGYERVGGYKYSYGSAINNIRMPELPRMRSGFLKKLGSIRKIARRRQREQRFIYEFVPVSQ